MTAYFLNYFMGLQYSFIFMYKISKKTLTPFSYLWSIEKFFSIFLFLCKFGTLKMKILTFTKMLLICCFKRSD